MQERHGYAKLPAMRMLLDVTDLMRIEAIASHGSFTRAAVVLGMTQPALTRSIATAERTVGGPLFLRGRRGAEPTALCRMILAEAPEIIGRMQELHDRLSHLRGGSGEEVSVVAGPFPLESIVLPATGAFRRAQPRIRVRIETLPWPAALAQLRQQRCDLAVLAGSVGLEGGDLVVEPLVPQRLVFAVGRGHPLARVARPALARILGYPFITTAQLAPVLHRALAEARGTRAALGPKADIPFPAVLVESSAAWLALVAQGEGVTLTTLAAAARFVETGEVVLLPVAAPWLVTRHAVVHVAARPLGAPASAFVAALRAANAAALVRAAAMWARLGVGEV